MTQDWQVWKSFIQLYHSPYIIPLGHDLTILDYEMGKCPENFLQKTCCLDISWNNGSDKFNCWNLQEASHLLFHISVERPMVFLLQQHICNIFMHTSKIYLIFWSLTTGGRTNFSKWYKILYLITKSFLMWQKNYKSPLQLYQNNITKMITENNKKHHLSNILNHVYIFKFQQKKHCHSTTFYSFCLFF